MAKTTASAVLNEEWGVAARETISHTPSRRQMFLDVGFQRLCWIFAALTLVFATFLVLRIAFAAVPAMRQYGPAFLAGKTWDPGHVRYGILPQIWGTVYTSLLALIISTAFGVAAAVYLSEGYLSQTIYGVLRSFNLHLHPFWGKLPDGMEDSLRNLIELLAAIPSVVYGLWGLFVVIPLIRPVCNWLHTQLGWIPFFSTDLGATGVLPAVMVLSIMLIPTITAISRSALVAVPSKLRMAAYGMGATRWETILGVIIPTAIRGIFGGAILAFGRALGETMALAMLAGGANIISLSLFSPVNTLAALLANSFPEAPPAETSILMYAALVLLGITLVVNVVGSIILQRTSAALEGTNR